MFFLLSLSFYFVGVYFIHFFYCICIVGVLYNDVLLLCISSQLMWRHQVGILKLARQEYLLHRDWQLQHMGLC